MFRAILAGSFGLPSGSQIPVSLAGFPSGLSIGARKMEHFEFQKTLC
jgi:hypothetical protein